MSLGIEDGRIPDSALTASTIHSGAYAATLARLNLAAASGKVGSWAAKKNDVNQWLKIDLGTPTTVTKVATQGRQDADQWITSYTLSYSLAGSFWVKYTVRGKKKVISVRTSFLFFISDSFSTCPRKYRNGNKGSGFMRLYFVVIH